MKLTPERISAYYDGLLSPQERRAVEHELLRSPEAREMLEDYRQIGRRLQSLQPHSAPAGLRSAVYQRIATSRRGSPWNSIFTGTWNMLGWAGAAVVILLLAIVFSGTLHGINISHNDFIRAAYPNQDAQNVRLDTTVIIQFTRPMDRDSVMRATSWVRLPDRGAVQVTPAWSPDNQTYTLKPDNLLQPGTSYFVSVSNQANDANDNPLQEPFTLNFTTEPLPTPTVTQVVLVVPTVTDTPTATPVKPTATAIPTATETPSPSPTPTIKATETPTTRPSETPSTTPEIVVPVPTATAVRPTSTSTNTPARPTATAVLPSPTPSVTRTPAQTATPTETATATITATATETPTTTATRTLTPTQTLTPAPVMTATVTGTLTVTLTPTHTATPTITPITVISQTPVITQTHLSTPTPSATATPTPVIELVPTPTKGITSTSLIQDNQIGGNGLFTESGFVQKNSATLPNQAGHGDRDENGGSENMLLLTFEHGAMLLDTDTQSIYIITSDINSRTNKSSEAGDKYEPQGRFGEIWRAQPEIRAILGYAVQPAASLLGSQPGPILNGTLKPATELGDGSNIYLISNDRAIQNLLGR